MPVIRDAQEMFLPPVPTLFLPQDDGSEGREHPPPAL